MSAPRPRAKAERGGVGVRWARRHPQLSVVVVPPVPVLEPAVPAEPPDVPPDPASGPASVVGPLPPPPPAPPHVPASSSTEASDASHAPSILQSALHVHEFTARPWQQRGGPWTSL